ncbi:hypothetical protein NRK67_03330 [Fusobacteria bacterium ZRK30]|nr:hypothetical protein NRK67_03330 [Fusobacteria bacterium ZRK30]
MTYFIDNATHTIHKSVCPHISLADMVMLGIYMDDEEALRDAKDEGYCNADGCWYCCSSCCSVEEKG